MHTGNSVWQCFALKYVLTCGKTDRTVSKNDVDDGDSDVGGDGGDGDVDDDGDSDGGGDGGDGDVDDDGDSDGGGGGGDDDDGGGYDDGGGDDGDDGGGGGCGGVDDGCDDDDVDGGGCGGVDDGDDDGDGGGCGGVDDGCDDNVDGGGCGGVDDGCDDDVDGGCGGVDDGCDVDVDGGNGDGPTAASIPACSLTYSLFPLHSPPKHYCFRNRSAMTPSVQRGRRRGRSACPGVLAAGDKQRRSRLFQLTNSWRPLVHRAASALHRRRCF